MEAERFRQIDELFAAALEQNPAERAMFLDSACAGDRELLSEVQSLLRAHERSGNFIESSALELSARAQALQAESAVGQLIGPYQILSLLGAGGMGDVYLAVDNRLGRRVALKLLPFEFTRDSGRLGRFEREARAASALNHPNIVTIYDIGQSEHSHFIAAEFVEGHTLRHLIAALDGKPELKPQLKIEEVLKVTSQVAEALSAAHAAGIIHRDIKPENIMLRPDGYVKVLDFGIAKLTERGSSPSVVRDSAEPVRTETGAVVGTVAYMSPEQALGWEVDQRTDIFNLGVVLYELLLGEHPFRGATNAATFDAILNRNPPLSGLQDRGGSAELERVILRALEKDRELRHQSADDLRSELKRLQRTLDSSPSGAGNFTDAVLHQRQTVNLSPRRIGLAIASLLIMTAVAIYFVIHRAGQRTGPAETATRIHPNVTQLTDRPGQELYPSLSPDGKVLIYTGRAAGNWDIYWQRVGGRNPRNLTENSPANDTQPAFSPDGEHIAFRSDREQGGIFIMGATGESARRLTDFGFFPAWSPDGSEIALASENFEDPNTRRPDASVIWIVNVATGAAHPLTEAPKGDATQPQWSPSGARIAYWGKHQGGQRDIWTIPARGGEAVPVTNDAFFDWNPVWSPDGKYLYFASDRGGSMNIWRVPIDEGSGSVMGQPEPFTAPSPYAQLLTFARDGKRAVYVNQVSSTNIYTIAFNPYKEAIIGQPVSVTQGFRHASAPDLSLDGQWFVYSSQGEMQEDIYLLSKDSAESPRKLTDDPYKDRNPRWSPDGMHITFYSNRSGQYEAWSINPDGSGLKQLTFTEGTGIAYPFWSPDGARLAYNRNNESCAIIEVAKPWTEQTPVLLIDEKEARYGAFWAFTWSSDGRKLGGAWLEPRHEHPGIVIYTFDTGSFDRITEFGTNPVWLKDNRRLLFIYQDKLYLVNSETKRVHEIKVPLSLPSRFSGYGLSADNRMIYYGLTTREADVWLLNME